MNRKENKFWKVVGYIALLTSILGGLAEFFNFIDIVPNGRNEAMQLTVYVQDKEGNPIPELQNNGIILVDFGNDRRAPLIGQNGRTNLGEIPNKFQGETIPIILEAIGYESVYPNKQYFMDGKPIYFTVAQDFELGTIEGIVKNQSGEEFISTALVMIDYDIITYTDSLGRFNVQMPLDKYRDKYRITVKKKGFKTHEEYLIPQSTKQEIRLEKSLES